MHVIIAQLALELKVVVLAPQLADRDLSLAAAAAPVVASIAVISTTTVGLWLTCCCAWLGWRGLFDLCSSSSSSSRKREWARTCVGLSWWWSTGHSSQ